MGDVNYSVRAVSLMASEGEIVT